MEEFKYVRNDFLIPLLGFKAIYTSHLLGGSECYGTLSQLKNLKPLDIHQQISLAISYNAN